VILEDKTELHATMNVAIDDGNGMGLGSWDGRLDGVNAEDLFDEDELTVRTYDCQQLQIIVTSMILGSSNVPVKFQGSGMPPC